MHTHGSSPPPEEVHAFAAQFASARTCEQEVDPLLLNQELDLIQQEGQFLYFIDYDDPVALSDLLTETLWRMIHFQKDISLEKVVVLMFCQSLPEKRGLARLE